MIVGYGVIAVPTGIVSAEMVRAKTVASTRRCPGCQVEEDRTDAAFCRSCGLKLGA